MIRKTGRHMANQKINALFTKGSFGRGRSSAFTIVEIITVIVVIGILASITVVSYAQITNNAKAKSVMADAAGMRAALIKYKSDHGAYPSSLDLLSSPPATTSSFQYSYDATAGTFCITASVNGASAYADSTTQQAKSGGCPGHGVNGQDPIKNLAINPSFEANLTGVSAYYVSNALQTSSPRSGAKFVRSTRTTTTGSWGP